MNKDLQQSYHWLLILTIALCPATLAMSLSQPFDNQTDTILTIPALASPQDGPGHG